MSEETEAPEAEAAAPGLDPAALALSLGAASQAQADAFLRQQGKVAELVARRLEHEERFEHAHLRWRRFDDQMKGAMRILLVAGGALLLGVVVAAMWAASHAEGLVVDAFSVPPAFATTGVTADVLADDLTVRVAAIRDFANDHSFARSNDVSQDRSEDIKVEIPETGVSLTQAWRYLKLWLGHERRLTGNLRDIGNGRIALTVALDGRDAFTVQGAAQELDGLEGQAAEKVFAQVDPENYVLYLGGKGRRAEGLAAAARLPQLAKTPGEMSDAYALWAGTTRSTTDDVALVIARARIAIAHDPKTTASHMELMNAFAELGHDEEALVQAREIAGKRKEDEPAWRNSDGVALAKLRASYVRNVTIGDFQQALSDPCRHPLCSVSDSDLMRAEYAARLHDGKLSLALSARAAAEGPADPAQQQRTRYFAAVAVENWTAALASAREYASVIQEYNSAARTRNIMVATKVMPLLAYALARTGDLAAAHRAIDGTPGDCTLCLDMRGNIDVVQDNWGGAQYWFARAVSASPSSVLAYADWGSMLLVQGKPDEAIAQFKLSNAKGPHFADALEGWGEALMAKNQSHLALEKFAQAEKYAPNWGRLHLKWGEALVYAGERDEAKAQFARAAHLDLTAAEKSELAQEKT
jgi:tetratricopeptide (TPR) repeat protein